jgi:hypothetical protein
MAAPEIKTHCPHGHPYDEFNTKTYTRKDGSQGRQCRECHRNREAARQARKSGTGRTSLAREVWRPTRWL